MTIYVDTAALYAILDADDANHAAARDVWVDLVNRQEELLCSNYVLVESFALVQHRLGIAAVRAVQEDIVPLLSIFWVDRAIHQAGISALLTAGQRRLSLVDCVSFVCMRQLGIGTAFTFDQHFADQGFVCLPGQAASTH